MFQNRTTVSRLSFFTVSTVSLLLACFAFFSSHTPDAEALTTTPTTMNFQGRLADSSGTIMPDGLYNMQFKLYTASTGGTLAWSETRQNSGTDTRVQVTNGLFSTKLGQATPLSASLFASGALYFEITMATPATATCNTAACAAWESPMSPRHQLSTSAYAYNAETLDGLDSTQLIQNTTTPQQGNIAIQSANAANVGITVKAAASQTGDLLQVQDSSGAMMSGIDRFGRIMFGTDVALQGAGLSVLTSDVSQQGVVVRGLAGQTQDLLNIQASTSTNLFSVGANGTTLIQNASATQLFKADTSSMNVVVGTATNGITFSSNGVVYSGTARATPQVMLVPEYPGATFRGDGTNNVGDLSSDFCSASTGGLGINTGICTNANEEHSYYQWSNTQATAQDYDIYVRYRIPQDYDTGSMADLSFTANGTTSGEAATLTLYKSGTQCSTTGDVVTTALTWSTGTVASPLGSCTIAAGDFVTFKIQLSAGQNNDVRSGEIGFTYRKARE